MKVLGSVLVLRRVAAADVAADHAHAQVDPSIADLHAILTHVSVRRLNLDLIEMSAVFGHDFYPAF